MKVKEYFDKLVADIKEVKDTQTEQQTTLVRQQVILDEHVRRSDANEKLIVLVKAELEKHKTDSVTWSFLGKALVNISVCIGVISGALKLFGVI